MIATTMLAMRSLNCVRIRHIYASLSSAILLIFASSAEGRVIRRRFEPEDFEWEDAGTSEVDLQFGTIRGPSVYRFMAPDYEIDLGLTKPRGYELGVATQKLLDYFEQWSLIGQISIVRFLSNDPNQLDYVGDVQWDGTSHLSISFVGLAGAASGSDRYGVLLGFFPKLSCETPKNFVSLNSFVSLDE